MGAQVGERDLGRTGDPIIRQGLARAYEMKKLREWVRAGAAARAKATGSSGFFARTRPKSSMDCP